MHEKMHVKLKKKKKKRKRKREGNMDIPVYGEKNLARNQEENYKKFVVEPCRVREREKSLKTFEKGELNKLRSNFKKSLFTIFN